MLKIRQGFLLRQMMNAYVAVAVGEAGEDFNGMIRLNDAGAWLWKELQQGIDKDELVGKMCSRYEGLDEATARQDLDEFLLTVRLALEKE